MTEENLFENVTTLLAKSAWTRLDHGVGGELWTSADQSSEVGVPFHFGRQSEELDGIVLRLEVPLKKPESEIRRDILKQFEDTQEYKIETEVETPDDVPLVVASDLLSTAWRITRAAATTARSATPTIGSYSKVGDEYARSARFLHTARGSFVLPVVMPVRPLKAEANQLNVPVNRLEPFERRVSRTVASSLAALDSLVITPDRKPDTNAVLELVSRGVSRQMVAAIITLLHNKTHTSLNASFDWARSIDKPGGLPARVEIPVGAEPVLADLERELRKGKSRPHQALTGPIVIVDDDPALPDGKFAMRAVHNGRETSVLVEVDGTTIKDAHNWARDRRTVRVVGDVDWMPGLGYVVHMPTFVAVEESLFIEPDSSTSA